MNQSTTLKAIWGRIGQRRLEIALCTYIVLVFVQSLFFKYTNSTETQHIFGTLDGWAASFGAGGLFAQTGLFSQYVIGTAELAASSLLGFAVVKRCPALLALGGILGALIMTGAISFHLFTPLGVEILGDGGLLFALACGVFLSGVTLAALNRKALGAALHGAWRAFTGRVPETLTADKPVGTVARPDASLASKH